MKKIILLRHGKPIFELKGAVRARDLPIIASSYDCSGIADRPANTTISALSESKFIVCSSLKRSVDSAKALGHTEIHLTDELFCESAIPHFETGAIKLPIIVWVFILRLFWLFGFSRNGESLTQARSRAKKAAASLTQLATEHRQVLFVGHGLINSLIARELRKTGWRGSSNPSRTYWEYSVFEQS
ncbi:MAG: histidine phosphatase family protein [Gammaproteobacteria bacterium]|nr:histidine phosphatase family protein [Gammaproteobacteria bacterium]